MENSTDKSDGTGCGGCATEKGKTCVGCSHRDGIESRIRVTLPPRGSTPNPSGCDVTKS